MRAVRAVARSGRLSLVVLSLASAIGSTSAQAPAPATAPAPPPAGPSRVDGQILRPGKRDLLPVGGVWVTIHRVGSDTAGPIDSMRVGADGRYRFRYTRTGPTDAVYFVSASYDGIAYFSRPLTTTSVSGDDAAIVVFDTTSVPFPLSIKGRHIIIASPNVDGTRQVVEAYEIANDSDHTLVSPDDAHPSFTARLPAGATSFQVGESDISPAAVSAAGGRVIVTAPFAPGLKQLSFSYRVPQSSFPLRMPVPQAATVLEVLLEEPKATANGSSLKAVAPVAIEGRPFLRFLGADAKAGSSVEVTVPVVQAPASERLYREIAIALAALMVAGFVAWLARSRARRARGAPAAPAREPDATETLARAIATLDAEFERAPSPDAVARAAYEERRRALKRELTSVLDSRSHSA